MQASNPELDRLIRERDQLSKQIKRGLVGMPRFRGIEAIKPDLLNRLGVAAFSSDQLVPIIAGPGVLAQEMAIEYNISQTEALRLLGAHEGRLVDALRNLDPRAKRVFERQFGTLYALDLITDPPSTSLRQGVRIEKSYNPKISLMKDLSEETVEIPTPSSLLEFGPGLNSVNKLMPEKEVEVVRSITMVEPNAYVVAALARGYEVTDRLFTIINRAVRRNPYSKLDPRKIAKLNLLQQTMGQFAAGRSKENFDFVIASMVHSAGDSEIVAALEKSHTLLREGGHLAIQAPDQVTAGQTNATKMLEMARSLYGDPIRQVVIDLQVQATGASHTGISALFRK